MKLLGFEVQTSGVWERVLTGLRERGISPPEASEPDTEPVEPRVDPIQHHLEGLERHGDPTTPLPLHTHRTGAGRAVLLAKWVFRKTCQPLINEAFGRQRLFNAHVRDAYSELAARVERLAADLETLQEKKPVRRRKPARAVKAKDQKTG